MIETLPTEILIQILLRLTNLTDLGSILHASPTVYRIFDPYAVEITQTILESGYVYKGWGKCRRLHKCGDMSPSIRCFILFIVLLRSSQLPAKSLDELYTIVWSVYDINERSQIFQNHPMYPGKPEPPGGRRHGFDPDPIPANTPPAVIRSVLATARRITWLALDCLQLHLARLRQVQPAHPAELERSFQKRPKDERKNYMLEPWNAKPPLCWPKVRDLGPPTWDEEDSVSYYLWRLQLYGDVTTAAAHAMLSWPAEDVEALDSRGGIRASWRSPDSNSKARDYLQEAHGQSSPAAVRIPWEKLQAQKREGPAPPLRDSTIGVARSIHRKSNALALGDFGPYQRLGFGFWCFELFLVAVSDITVYSARVSVHLAPTVKAASAWDKQPAHVLRFSCVG